MLYLVWVIQQEREIGDVGEKGELLEQYLKWARGVGIYCIFQGVCLSEEQEHFSHYKREGTLYGTGACRWIDGSGSL